MTPVSWADSPWAICEVSALMKWACAPSWVAPASKELRVRVELSKNMRKIVLFGRTTVGSPARNRRFNSPESLRNSSISGTLHSCVTIQSRPWYLLSRVRSLRSIYASASRSATRVR